MRTIATSGMASGHDKLKKELVAKEEALMSNETRSDAEAIAALIDDGCVEITIAGSRREYRRGDSLEPVDGALYIDDSTVILAEISADAALLQYVGARVKKNVRQKARFCSIWKNSGGEWKLAFRQGTVIAE